MLRKGKEGCGSPGNYELHRSSRPAADVRKKARNDKTRHVPGLAKDSRLGERGEERPFAEAGGSLLFSPRF